MTLIAPNNILWRNSVRAGFFHRHTIAIMQITSEDVEYIDEEKHITTRIPWGMVSDVVIMNHRNVGTGFHQTIGTGGFYNRIYTGYNNWQSTSVG